MIKMNNYQINLYNEAVENLKELLASGYEKDHLRSELESDLFGDDNGE